MNVAIIISVSVYEKFSNLPGCLHDGNIIKSVLEKSNIFEDILFLSGDIKSSKLKGSLSEFIVKYRDGSSKIENLFFYYSGHGSYSDNDFNYIPSDFDDSKKRQTSLSNFELDELLRQINSELTVKVVDACESQHQYIKSSNDFLSFLDKTKNIYNHCYFFFSSLNNQASYQSDKISYFTESFVKSILDSDSEEVRYKDIIDYLSDDFEKNPSQTPYFVNQAMFTELFGTFDETAKKELSDLLDSGLKTDNGTKNSETNLIDIIVADAKKYCDWAEVVDIAVLNDL